MASDMALSASAATAPVSLPPAADPASIQWEELGGAADVRFDPPHFVGRETLTLRIELGRGEIRREEAESLRTGSLVQLSNSAAAPVDLYVGRQLVGRGEAVAVAGKLGVRVLQLFSTGD